MITSLMRTFVLCDSYASGLVRAYLHVKFGLGRLGLCRSHRGHSKKRVTSASWNDGHPTKRGQDFFCAGDGRNGRCEA
jgi:hypothetical protein